MDIIEKYDALARIRDEKEEKDMNYLRENPDIIRIAQDYITSVLLHKPENPVEYTFDYFSHLLGAPEPSGVWKERIISINPPTKDLANTLAYSVSDPEEILNKIQNNDSSILPSILSPKNLVTNLFPIYHSLLKLLKENEIQSWKSGMILYGVATTFRYILLNSRESIQSMIVKDMKNNNHLHGSNSDISINNRDLQSLESLAAKSILSYIVKLTQSQAEDELILNKEEADKIVEIVASFLFKHLSVLIILLICPKKSKCCLYPEEESNDSSLPIIEENTTTKKKEPKVKAKDNKKPPSISSTLTDEEIKELFSETLEIGTNIIEINKIIDTEDINEITQSDNINDILLTNDLNTLNNKKIKNEELSKKIEDHLKGIREAMEAHRVISENLGANS